MNLLVNKMLEQIFGSLARTKIIKFFCLHSEEEFFVRELTRLLNTQLNSIRRELDNLVSFGFLSTRAKDGKHFYAINKSCPLLPELKNIVFKAITLEEMQVAHKMSKATGLTLLLFTGVLSNVTAGTDVLIVGKVNKNDFYKYLEKIADGLNGKLRYTFFSKADYIYRTEVTDKFLYDILSQPHIVVIDKLNKENNKPFDDFNFKHFRQ